MSNIGTKLSATERVVCGYGSPGPIMETSDTNVKLLKLMPVCQAVMRQVGDLLLDKTSIDWQKKGVDLRAAAAVMDLWVDGIKNESEAKNE